jgi:hypothetical protein
MSDVSSLLQSEPSFLGCRGLLDYPGSTAVKDEKDASELTRAGCQPKTPARVTPRRVSIDLHFFLEATSSLQGGSTPVPR